MKERGGFKFRVPGLPRHSQATGVTTAGFKFQVNILIFALGGLLLSLIFASCSHPPRTVKEDDIKYSSDFGGVYHKVEKGQTLWRISRSYDVDLETLQWVNDIEDVTQIKTGRVIFIPGASMTLKIKPFITGEGKPSKTVLTLQWPLKSRISSTYGPRDGKKHYGLDMAAKTGVPVKAAATGRVAYSGNGMRGYGKVIVLKHSDDLSTVYAHNSKLLVSMGERVKGGQIIARVGATGRVTGPHLHFEVRRRGVPEDPLDFLPSP